MAYSANAHNIWVARIKDLMRHIDAIAFREGDILDEIYLNQGGNVAPETWVDTPEATKDELIVAITTIRELQQFLDGSAAVSQVDRRSRFAPFLQ